MLIMNVSYALILVILFELISIYKTVQTERVDINNT